MDFIEKYKSDVLSSIEEFKAQNKSTDLYQPINYILSLGGKRMRPILTLMSANLFGGKSEDAKHAALAVEVFHNFTLLHDDIMDDAPLRRGEATVHEKWNTNSAILSGDAMMVQSYQLLAKSKNITKLLPVFNKAAIEVCEGQQDDMAFESRNDVALEEYIEMITNKTSVLLGAALQMGAIEANASTEDAQHIYEFGKNIGIAFQIQDDILDAYGDADKFGKRVGGDIVSNKKTYLLITAKQKSNTQELEELNSALSINNEDEQIEAVKSIFNHLGVRQDATKAMDYYFEKAIEALNQITSVSDKKKQPLLALANYLIKREE